MKTRISIPIGTIPSLTRSEPGGRPRLLAQEWFGNQGTKHLIRRYWALVELALVCIKKSLADWTVKDSRTVYQVSVKL